MDYMQILNEIKSLGDNLQNKIERLDNKFDDFHKEMVKFSAHVKPEVNTLKEWKGRVDEVASPTQLKELKDEVYKQKNKWTATIAVITFAQILITAYFSYEKKMSAVQNNIKYNKEAIIPQKESYNIQKEEYVKKDQ